MPAPLGAAVKQTLLSSGWYGARLEAASFPGVAVLCYHGVRADNDASPMPFDQLHVRAAELDAHCSLARGSCNPISLDQWRAAASGGRALPPRPVLFTFDDGYRNVYTQARVILERYRIPAVIFACSGPIRARTAFWYDAMAQVDGEHAVEQAKTAGGDWQRSRDAWLERAVDDRSPLAAMRPDELKQLAGHELFEIGSHTATHPVLSSLPADRQHAEIESGCAAVAALTGAAVRSFAYPNGRPGIDYSAETVEIVRRAGVDAAFTIAPKFAAPSEPPLERSRFLMLSGITTAELAHRLAYSWRH